MFFCFTWLGIAYPKKGDKKRDRNLFKQSREKKIKIKKKDLFPKLNWKSIKIMYLSQFYEMNM